jgi:UDP:flavonoid glycosyltransferase YjiC (YdhE family)
MRVLVASTALAGHFAALMPFAAALRDGGHEVRVAVPASFCPAVQKAGFACAPLADAPPEEIGPVFARLPNLSLEAANAVIFSEVFCGIDARAALPAMQAIVDEWQPDVILRETAEFASYLVAERTGTPYVQVAISLDSLEEFMKLHVEQPLRELGSQSGLAGLFSSPRLTLFPASLEGQVQTEARQTHRFQYPMPPASQTRLPQDWWPESDAPLVYMTFGSVAASIGFFPDFYRAAAKALADVPARVLLTLGEAGDPERLGPLPSNIHVERWWPQEQVMPHAAAMVTHGGLGTTLPGLTAGIPMVVVPLFALDQYANARGLHSVGAGVAVENAAAAPSDIRSALERVLNDPGYRSAAHKLADEIAALPHPSTCIGVLESLLVNQPTRAIHPDQEPPRSHRS